MARQQGGLHAAHDDDHPGLVSPWVRAGGVVAQGAEGQGHQVEEDAKGEAKGDPASSNAGAAHVSDEEGNDSAEAFHSGGGGGGRIDLDTVVEELSAADRGTRSSLIRGGQLLQQQVRAPPSPPRSPTPSDDPDHPPPWPSSMLPADGEGEGEGASEGAESGWRQQGGDERGRAQGDEVELLPSPPPFGGPTSSMKDGGGPGGRWRSLDHHDSASSRPNGGGNGGSGAVMASQPSEGVDTDGGEAAEAAGAAAGVVAAGVDHGQEPKPY